ncbi:hypothetical protein J2X02_001726 [Pseudoxanthomonas japonensis]|uniref:hypothetical protein n=1 Tax=Pseudoxanthomonas japonensis TaxID=69284 RepID=UPI002854B4DB|nr:hypothetical protein [Pseudoxanthomonas japonensis]MDR7068875.1 hypothetical protein [Pseudoxanthomonas japonensis]
MRISIAIVALLSTSCSGSNELATEPIVESSVTAVVSIYEVCTRADAGTDARMLDDVLDPGQRVCIRSSDPVIGIRPGVFKIWEVDEDAWMFIVSCESPPTPQWKSLPSTGGEISVVANGVALGRYRRDSAPDAGVCGFFNVSSKESAVAACSHMARAWGMDISECVKSCHEEANEAPDICVDTIHER